MLAPVAQAVTPHLKDEEEEEKEEEEEEEQHQSLSLVPTVIGKQGKNMKRIADSCGAKLRIRGKGVCHGHLLSNIVLSGACTTV